MLSRGPRYNRDLWEKGLARHGYLSTDTPLNEPGPGDLLIVWNRIGRVDQIASRYQAGGAKVIVVENGWCGRDKEGSIPYSAALDYHNGVGKWPVGKRGRWKRWKLDIKPWRTEGDVLLTLPQRGIGEKPVGMTRGWEVSAAERLRRLTERPVVNRPHPGGPVNERPEIDWTGIYAAVTWGSAAAVKALLAGVPVFYELENWIGAPAAKFGLGDSRRWIDTPYLGDREAMLDRLAWAQWDAEEIEKGEPVEWLVNSSTSTSSIRPAPVASPKPSPKGSGWPAIAPASSQSTSIAATLRRSPKSPPSTD